MHNNSLLCHRHTKSSFLRCPFQFPFSLIVSPLIPLLMMHCYLRLLSNGSPLLLCMGHTHKTKRNCSTQICPTGPSPSAPQKGAVTSIGIEFCSSLSRPRATSPILTAVQELAGQAPPKKAPPQDVSPGVNERRPEQNPWHT